MSLNRAFGIGLGLVMLCASSMRPAQAGFIFNVSQVGNDVVVSGSGALNTDALILQFAAGGTSYGINPGNGVIGVGTSTPYTAFTGLSGPAGFGTIPSFANGLISSANGDLVVLTMFNNRLYLPQSHISGGLLSGTSTYANRTLADVGLTPGTTAEYTWGSGPTADFIRVTVRSALPEPPSIVLLGATLAGVSIGRRKRSGARRRRCSLGSE